MTQTTARKGFFRRLPIIGTIIRDCEKDVDSVLWLIGGLVSLLIIATVTWGLPVLAMTAVVMVPVMFILLILITMG